MTPLRLAILNLTRHRIPTSVAVLAISIAVACSGVLYRLYLLSQSRFSYLARGGDAIVGAKAGEVEILLNALGLEGPFPDYLPLRLYESLKRKETVLFEDGKTESPSAVKGIVPFLVYGSYQNHRVIATEESFIRRPDPADSLLFKEGNWPEGDSGVLVGASVAQIHRLKLNDTLNGDLWLGTQSNIATFPLKVTGVLSVTDSAWDDALFTNLSAAKHVFEITNSNPSTTWNRDVLHFYLVYLEPNGFSALENLVNRRTVAQAVSIPAARARLEKWTGTGKELGTLVSLLILLLGALSVAGMMVTRYDSMMVQLAVLRAMGYAKGEIRAWLVWEGILLGLVAVVIGGALDAAAFPLLKNLLGGIVPVTSWAKSPFYSSAPVWISALFATTLASILPILRLYRQDVHAALKGV